MYGHDLANSRVQTDEVSLSPLRAATLAPVWRYDMGESTKVLGFVALNGTPIVADGCVFIGDQSGKVVALNADTGAVVWQHRLVVPTRPQQSGGLIVSSPLVTGQSVIFAVNRFEAPYLVAFDVVTGKQRWQSAPLVSDPGSYSNASPALLNGVLIAGFSEPEGVVSAHGGFALVDAASGALLARTYTIPPADWVKGFGGGGIWSTAAIDASSGYAYLGTGNPYSKKTEHPRTNAIIKVDIDRRRATFASIVASYKGEIDQRLPLLKQLSKATCALLPENPIPQLPFPAFFPDLNQAKDSYACLQFDLDFGGSPNLIASPSGLLVGELQKSGVYHVVEASTLSPVRKITLGVSCLVCNGASTAYDPATGGAIADVTPGSSLAAFAPATGGLRWIAPVGDGIHYQPIAVADGVAYTFDSAGFLDAYDEHSGVPLLHRPLPLDGATDAIGALASGGVSIARHTVYVAAGSHVIAYRPALG
jgi:outer membrane protein assembly factor BamB